ncbi:hypothetical protein SAMN05216597_4520 [Pseudomonas cannabina]|nr:hypothetical protein SAMN05216597_4520 [Pseudomonas cannabina]
MPVLSHSFVVRSRNKGLMNNTINKNWAVFFFPVSKCIVHKNLFKETLNN